ncbi:O-antigen ligase family protein [Niastella sp. OAS944]|uniref:O-antigen ligase family protein n=1 Tax=Niastella sp. OAS944 TaxID=2664089 RepID=UPI0034865A7D|nr:O-antigen ligase [Chitinophagaceae bacterium OAS944]
MINNLLYFFYLAFMVSMVGGFRAISSITIGLILVAGFIKNKLHTGSWFNGSLRNRHLFFCSLFFLLQLIYLPFASDFTVGWKHVQVKSATLFIPLCFYCCSFINKSNFRSLMYAYVYTVAIVLTWCLGFAFKQNFFHHAPITVFFYHQLVRDLGHHAIQFSILVFAALIYLLHSARQGSYLLNRRIHYLLTAYFMTGTFLLSSKLVIIFLLGYLALYGFNRLQQKFNTRWAVAIVVMTVALCSSSLLFTQNPISGRFNDVIHGDVRVITQTSFTPNDYFNGIQFRLLQWRFVKEILQENRAWLLGVSPAKAQQLLDQKYISTHMYTGTGRPGDNTHGYLGYNTHNEFLESLLQTGLIGLLCFIGICAEMIGMAIRQKNKMLTSLVALLLAYTFGDAVFETQYGLILFLFLPLFFFFGQKDKELKIS